MLPSLAAKLAKAEAHNAKLNSSKKYAKKVSAKLAVTASGSFSDCFTSLEEKENWLEAREAAKRASHSDFY